LPRVKFENMNKEVTIQQGETILKAANKGRVALNHRCGGNGSCNTCKINIDSTNINSVSSPNQIEKRMISQVQLESGQRLGCQVKVYDHISLTIPEDPLKAFIRAQLERQRNEDDLL
jgi:2Fe-2S ferredoxin